MSESKPYLTEALRSLHLCKKGNGLCLSGGMFDYRLIKEQYGGKIFRESLGRSCVTVVSRRTNMANSDLRVITS